MLCILEIYYLFYWRVGVRVLSWHWVYSTVTIVYTSCGPLILRYRSFSSRMLLRGWSLRPCGLKRASRKVDSYTWLHIGSLLHPFSVVSFSVIPLYGPHWFPSCSFLNYSTYNFILLKANMDNLTYQIFTISSSYIDCFKPWFLSLLFQCCLSNCHHEPAKRRNFPSAALKPLPMLHPTHWPLSWKLPSVLGWPSRGIGPSFSWEVGVTL